MEKQGQKGVDTSLIDLSLKRSECERSNATWNECEHFLKANLDWSENWNEHEMYIVSRLERRLKGQ